VDDGSDPEQNLAKTVQDAIESLETRDEATEKRKKKRKRSKS
jgi:hypothetical protein